VVVRVTFVLPHMRAGGIEKVVLEYLRRLDRRCFQPRLVLFAAKGELLGSLPADVEVMDGRGRRAHQLVPFLRKALRKTDTEVTFSGTNAANVAVMLAASTIRPSPKIILSEHTPPSDYLRSAKLARLRQALMRFFYPHATAIVVPVDGIGAELRRMLGNEHLRIVTVPNPVPVGAAPPRDRCPQASNVAPWFVSVGRLAHAKGHDILIRAFARLRRNCPQARLTIFGEGAERPRLEALCTELGLGQAVELPGFVDQPVAVVAGATAFVMASRREGFGIAIVEALAAGIPVVATDSVGPRAILAEGAFGLLVPQGDERALVAAMERMIADGALTERLRRWGPKRATDFSPEVAIQALSSLLLTVGGAKPAPEVDSA